MGRFWPPHSALENRITSMRFARLILNFINWLVIIGITLLAAYLIGSRFSIFGGYRSFLVQSGSMEPSIMMGDIIVVRSKTSYSLNDVVTFMNSAGRIVTHRIAEARKESEGTYLTKGDANRSEDEDAISNRQIIGTVALVIPGLGYFVAFAQSAPGLIILVLIPAAIYIMDELLKIKNAQSRS